MNIREYLMEKQAAKRVGIFRRIARNYNDAAKKIGVTGELAVASGTAALASGTIGRYLNENKKDRATAIGAGVAGATAPIAGASLALDGLRNPAKSSFKILATLSSASFKYSSKASLALASYPLFSPFTLIKARTHLINKKRLKNIH